MPAFRYQNGDRPLDGYTIQHALGRGGFGEVYFAISDAGREVALKAVQNYEDIELRGISHCMNLKSPHLVMIFDVKKDDEGLAWVIMEYVAGANLRELLDESGDGFGIEQAVYFMRELCKGVSYLHEADVVHRDLKPHNIFFEDGVVKIGDYSLSKAISTSHRSGHTSTVGSVHYMAPEISEGRYDKTVDIYALGVILYEMLTGRPPHEGESMAEVLMKHLTSEPDVSMLPQPFRGVVSKAMRRDPGQRYQTASEMLHDLSTGNELDYSRPPASLSLIGQRAAQQRSKQVRQPAAMEETFATPIAFRDTDSKDASQPFERPSAGDLNSLGLWWRPKAGSVVGKDPVPGFVRGLIGFAACLLIVPIGCSADANSFMGIEAIGLAISHAIFSSLVCWYCLSVMPRSGSFRWALLTRILSAFAFVPLIIITEESRSSQMRSYWAVPVAMLITFVLTDIRCAIDSQRRPRIGFAKTLVAGSITMLFTFLNDGGSDHVLLAGALTLSLSIVIQVLAPHSKLVPSSEQPSDKPSDDAGTNQTLPSPRNEVPLSV